jgi:hypothetical protein
LPGTRYPYCQVLPDLGNTASVHELPPGVIVIAGGPRPQGLPVAAYRSQAFRRSAGILPWSCHFAPLSRSKGKRGRPIDQAAPICHDGLERIGPPAGDLSPATACPAGPARSLVPRPTWAWLQGLWSPAGSGCSWSAPASATRHLHGSIGSTAGTSAPTAPSHPADRHSASAGSRAVASARGMPRPRLRAAML